MNRQVCLPPEKVKLFETLRGLADNGFQLFLFHINLMRLWKSVTNVMCFMPWKNIGTENTKDMTKQSWQK